MNVEELIKNNDDNTIYIEIGTKLFIEVKFVGVITNSIFVGLKYGEYVVITPPNPFSIAKPKLYPGNQVIIKYLFDGTIYVFETKIIEMLNNPIKMLLLEYPKVVRNQDVRKLKRIVCAIPGKMKSSSDEITGVMKDITLNGCCFIINASNYQNQFKKDSQIDLFCKFPGVEGDKKVKGLIKNIRQEKQEVEIGIAYIDLSEEYKDNIRQYIMSVSIV